MNHFSVLDPAFMVSAGQLWLCTSPCFLFVYTCVMEPPGFVDGMSGGGSVMVSGLTAASRPLSCGRPGSDGWPPCWKAGEGQGQVCSSHNPIYITTEAVYRPGWSSKLTGVVEQVLVMSNLGHVSRRHGVRGENWPTQGRGPQVIGAQCLLLGFTMWRERPGLFCNHTNRVKPRPDLY